MKENESEIIDKRIRIIPPIQSSFKLISISINHPVKAIATDVSKTFIEKLKVRISPINFVPYNSAQIVMKATKHMPYENPVRLMIININI